MIVEAIEKARQEYSILNEFTNGQVISEMTFIRNSGIPLHWDEASWQAYKRLSRVGRTFGLNREKRGKLFAAMTVIERTFQTQMKSKIKTESDFKNDYRRITALENALMGDVEKI